MPGVALEYVYRISVIQIKGLDLVRKTLAIPFINASILIIRQYRKIYAHANRTGRTSFIRPNALMSYCHETTSYEHSGVTTHVSI